jgi:hypothetical protein
MRATTEIRKFVQRLSCTECGAEAHASCNCGKPYVPAKQRAAEAIAANPLRSNRAIAEEIGVSDETVNRARRETPATDVAPEREGRDGKVYRLPVRAAVNDSDDDIEADVEPDNRRSAFLIRADQARQFAAYSGPIDHETYAAAQAAAERWSSLAAEIQHKLGEA